MRDKGLHIGLHAVFAIVTVVLSVTGTRAFAREKVLHNFHESGRGGQGPSGLTLDGAGNFYGTTTAGGAFSVGTVFELMPRTGGGWTEKVLHTFKNNGRDGTYPLSGVIFDAAGNLYGATPRGGIYNGGVVLKLAPKGDWRVDRNYSS
jgi:uncharacterized repeat protein (TIGR03803 family)